MYFQLIDYSAKGGDGWGRATAQKCTRLVEDRLRLMSAMLVDVSDEVVTRGYRASEAGGHARWQARRELRGTALP
jgi:hypothetical protein